MTHTLPSTASTARHEAAHCASLVLSGMVPMCVRVDQPAADRLGSTTPDWERHDLTAHNLRELLIAVLVSPILDGEPLDETDWPINLDGWSQCAEADSEMIGFLVRLLQLDRVGWVGAVTRARLRTRDTNFRALAAAISAALERVELVLQPELQEIADRVLEAPRD